MAQFHVSFSVQGAGQVELPVTPLDNLIVMVNGLEVATFRFSVQNTLAIPVTLDVASAQTGPDADAVAISFDLNPVTIEPGASEVITTTITPLEPLLEGMLIDVAVTGTQAA